MPTHSRKLPLPHSILSSGCLCDPQAILFSGQKDLQCSLYIFNLHGKKSMRDRDTKRDRDSEKETDTARQRQKETDTEAKRQ